MLLSRFDEFMMTYITRAYTLMESKDFDPLESVSFLFLYNDILLEAKITLAHIFSLKSQIYNPSL